MQCPAYLLECTSGLTCSDVVVAPPTLQHALLFTEPAPFQTKSRPSAGSELAVFRVSILERVWQAGSLEDAHAPPPQSFLVIPWGLPLSHSWGTLLHLLKVVYPPWMWPEAQGRSRGREWKFLELVPSNELGSIHLSIP